MSKKQKIFPVGDVHGTDYWKSALEKGGYKKGDIVVFMGDYFDYRWMRRNDPNYPESISFEDQMKNFNDILAFRETDPENIYMLWGNHDGSYACYDTQGPTSSDMFENEDQCMELCLIFQDLDKKGVLKKMLLLKDRFLFSHAGISDAFLQARINYGLEPYKTVEQVMHDMDMYKVSALWTDGADGRQLAPLWNRLPCVNINGLIQVVGHTPDDGCRRIGNTIYVDSAQRCIVNIENEKYASGEDKDCYRFHYKKYYNEGYRASVAREKAKEACKFAYQEHRNWWVGKTKEKEDGSVPSSQAAA